MCTGEAQSSFAPKSVQMINVTQMEERPDEMKSIPESVNFPVSLSDLRFTILFYVYECGLECILYTICTAVQVPEETRRGYWIPWN